MAQFWKYHDVFSQFNNSMKITNLLAEATIGTSILYPIRYHFEFILLQNKISLYKQAGVWFFHIQIA